MGGIQSPVLQEWSPVGSQAVDQCVHPPRASGVGAQATDWAVHPPGGFGSVRPGSLADDLGAHQPGLQVCAGAAYPVFIVQVLREWGRKKPLGCCGQFSKQPPSTSVFSFSF